MGFDTVLINVAILVAFSVPGYLLMRFKKLKDGHVKGLVVILVFAAQPAMVAKSFLSLKFSLELGINILICVSVFLLVMLTVLLIASFVFRRYRKNNANKPQETDEAKKEEDNRVFRFTSMFGNTGYLGLPLVSALFPDKPVMLLYTSICIVMFNILTWTLGVYVITGDKKSVSLKKIVSPVLIAAVVTVPFFFMPKVVIPDKIIAYFSTLSLMTTPLSMLIMGARMAQIPFVSVFNRWRVYLSCALRLIAAPLLAVAFLKLFRITDPETFNTVLTICAMPSAAAAILFAENFLEDSYAAIKAVLCSSILCIATIPVFLYLFLI